MSTTAVSRTTDWRQDFFEIEDAIFLNTATQGIMPKASFRALQTAMEWKKFPHHMPDDTTSYFGIPNRVRALLAKLIGGKAEEFALSSGASSGIAPIAYNFPWQPGDEVITAAGEFPLQYATWKPMELREGIHLKIISPRERFISADDFIAALTPKTRLVSASLCRFDDSALLDAARVAEACHKQGALLLLDASQCCGAIPMDLTRLGADFLVCAGYKWLLGPYGTGFLWVKNEHMDKMRPGPFYWRAADGAEDFHSLGSVESRPARNAIRWDAAETASYFNLLAWEASLEFILSAGLEAIAEHSRRLTQLLYEKLPKDRCVTASPTEPARRGPYACFAARTQEKTLELFERLKQEKVIVTLREGNIRVSPHVYNTERDIDKLIEVITP